MKRRILLVDDEVAVLLTLKAVLEISGFDVDTAASAREGKLKIRSREYQMVITDMRMESEEAGREVILAARTAPYHPAVALLTAFPVGDEDWRDMGADKMLLKPMQTRMLLKSIETLLATHSAKLGKLSTAAAPAATTPEAEAPAPVKKAAAKKTAGTEKSAGAAEKKQPATEKPAVAKKAAPVKKATAAKKTAAAPAKKTAKSAKASK